MEFYCKYCKAWITDKIHPQHYHNSTDKPDESRDHRVRVDGVIYEDEEEYLTSIKDPHTIAALLKLSEKYINFGPRH